MEGNLPFFLPPLVGFCTTLFLIKLLDPVAKHIGLVDRSGGHKDHAGLIPLTGGIAMFCGFLFAVLIANIPLAQYKPLFAGAAILVITGILDDFHELTARTRFIAQIIAFLIMTLWADVVLRDLGPLLNSQHFYLDTFAVPFTIFAAVGVANAINMVDGVDGLAGTLSMTVFAFLCFLNLDTAGANLHIMLIIISVIAGFLVLNLQLTKDRTASVFMGDTGSLFIGFLLAWFLTAETQQPYNTITPVTALWIFAIPLFDTVAIMSRRMFKRGSPFKSDRAHLHHILLAAGFDSRQIVLTLFLAAIVCGGIGVLGEARNVPDYIMYYLFLGVFAIYYIATKMALEHMQKHSIT